MSGPLEYEITVSVLDDGMVMVQVAGVPHPVGMFKETGYDLERLLDAARDVIVEHRNAEVSASASSRKQPSASDPRGAHPAAAPLGRQP